MMVVEAQDINTAIEELRAARDLLRRLIATNPSDELIGRRDQVEDQLIGALQERRRRTREEVIA